MTKNRIAPNGTFLTIPYTIELEHTRGKPILKSGMFWLAILIPVGILVGYFLMRKAK